MTNILALDAATEQCSAAVLLDQDMTSMQSDKPKAHAQSLLPMVDSLLGQSDLSLMDLDCIAYDCGPGSFTGLRICLGVAQGLAYGSGLSLVSVNSLEAMAFSSQQMFRGRADGVVCLLDARMGEVYWAAYFWGQSRPEVFVEPTLESIESIGLSVDRFMSSLRHKPIAIVGSGVHLLEEPFRSQFAIEDEALLPHAESIAKLAQYHAASGFVVSPEKAELTYLRNEVSWNKRQRIRSV